MFEWINASKSAREERGAIWPAYLATGLARPADVRHPKGKNLSECSAAEVAALQVLFCQLPNSLGKEHCQAIRWIVGNSNHRWQGFPTPPSQETH